jgi:hypothetical protein
MMSKATCSPWNIIHISVRIQGGPVALDIIHILVSIQGEPVALDIIHILVNIQGEPVAKALAALDHSKIIKKIKKLQLNKM